jgi:hypothetical protein
MRFSTSKLLTIPLGLAAMLSACSGGETPTSPELPSFAPTGTMPPAAGKVTVCAFYFGGFSGSSSYNLTVSNPASNNDFSLAPVPGCETFDAAAGSTAVSDFLTVTAGAQLDSVVILDGDAATPDEHIKPGAAAAVALTRTVPPSGLAFWYKFSPTTDTPKGTQGCTPGYWKQEQHFDSWVGYTTGQSFESIVGRNVFANSDPSMLTVLGLNGGGLNALSRHTAAALLNAAAGSGVNYAYTTAQIIAGFQAAFDSGNANTIEAQKNLFDAANNGVGGCPLN